VVKTNKVRFLATSTYSPATHIGGVKSQRPESRLRRWWGIPQSSFEMRSTSLEGSMAIDLTTTFTNTTLVHIISVLDFKIYFFNVIAEALPRCTNVFHQTQACGESSCQRVGTFHTQEDFSLHACIAAVCTFLEAATKSRLGTCGASILVRAGPPTSSSKV
jgi:hypothetical protein